MKRFCQIYFITLGAIVLLTGILEMCAAIFNLPNACPFVAFSHDAFRGIWGSLIMIFSGIYYLAGIRLFGEVHQLAKLTLASILLWIMAATDIFTILTAAIPDPDGQHWVNTLHGFLNTLAPPYSSAIILLPFSLLIIPCLRYYKQIPPVTDTPAQEGAHP